MDNTELAPPWQANLEKTGNTSICAQIYILQICLFRLALTLIETQKKQFRYRTFVLHCVYEEGEENCKLFPIGESGCRLIF